MGDETRIRGFLIFRGWYSTDFSVTGAPGAFFSKNFTASSITSLLSVPISQTCILGCLEALYR